MNRPTSSGSTAAVTGPASSGPAPLSVARRRELQQKFEQAWRWLQDSSTPWTEVHPLLLECTVADPASALYADALLLNLRRFDHNRKRLWLVRWPRQSRIVAAALRRDWLTVLRLGPDVLSDDPRHLPVLLALIDAHHALGHRESAWRYAEEALRHAPHDAELWRRCGRVQASRGNFSPAQTCWQEVLRRRATDPEATRMLAALGPSEPFPPAPALVPSAPLSALARALQPDSTPPSASDEFSQELARIGRSLQRHGWDEATALAGAAAARSGQDLRWREVVEELQWLRADAQLRLAERLVACDDDPAWRRLVDELRDSQERLAGELLAARCRRYPEDPLLHARLASLLGHRGHWAEAARCWEMATRDPCREAAVAAWVQLGETRQRLRQFPEALACYRRALALDDGPGEPAAWLERARRRVAALEDHSEGASTPRQNATDSP